MLVAVKYPRKTNPRSVVDEAALLARIQHPNVVRLYGFGPCGEMVLELGRIALVDRLPWDRQRTRDGMRQLLDAVSYLHAHNVAHRDIKADNVVVRHDDHTLVLIDFDLAVSFGHRPRPHLVHNSVGSLFYAAPEVVDRAAIERGYDPYLADMWSLGILLFAMIFSHVPFEKASSTQCRRFARFERDIAMAPSESLCVTCFSTPARKLLNAGEISLMDAMLCIDPAGRSKCKDVCFAFATRAQPKADSVAYVT